MPRPLVLLVIAGVGFALSAACGNSSSNGHKVRDRLCQIIGQYKFNPELVKAYTMDYCTTAELKNAPPEQLRFSCSTWPRRPCGPCLNRFVVSKALGGFILQVWTKSCCSHLGIYHNERHPTLC